MIRSYALLGNETAIMAELSEADAPASHKDLIADLDVSLTDQFKADYEEKVTHDVERQIILKVLKANAWNRQKTAKWLQISYRSLLYKLNEAEVPKIRRPPQPVDRPEDSKGLSDQSECFRLAFSRIRGSRLANWSAGLAAHDVRCLDALGRITRVHNELGITNDLGNVVIRVVGNDQHAVVLAQIVERR